ncbi:MAG: tRNA (uridine(54)-C5)-methyltransferase TrmA [Campylobacterota bacterium]|nr:tRNA (uridine(54)-C5)-methyltransferase TrmA [Campylobacterota bacterium]
MRCKHFGECGSCRNYELSYDEQLEGKVARIQKMFSPFYSGNIDVFESPQEHYRARSEFKIWHVEDEIHYAMNALYHKGVVLIEECPMVSESIASLMPNLLLKIKECGIDRKLFGADFLSTQKGELLVTLIYHRKLDDEWKHKAQEIAKELGIKIIGRSRKQKIVLSDDFVVETLNINEKKYEFKQIENSFTQPNAKVNEKMLGWAMKQFDGLDADLLELYCGAGNFTIPFASKFTKVLATEISKSSINAAKTNMQLNGVDNIEFVRMGVEEFTQALDGVRAFRRMKDIDIASYTLESIFVDPPRSGMDENTCKFTSRFDNILYISCNPETLLVDLERLKEHHKVVSMALFDQFPYTNHLEMGVKLQKL